MSAPSLCDAARRVLTDASAQHDARQVGTPRAIKAVMDRRYVSSFEDFRAVHDDIRARGLVTTDGQITAAGLAALSVSR